MDMTIPPPDRCDTPEPSSRGFVSLPDLQAFLKERLDYTPSEKTIIAWRSSGCPHLRLGERCIRYSPDDVMAWLLKTRLIAKGCRKPTLRQHPIVS